MKLAFCLSKKSINRYLGSHFSYSGKKVLSEITGTMGILVWKISVLVTQADSCKNVAASKRIIFKMWSQSLDFLRKVRQAICLTSKSPALLAPCHYRSFSSTFFE